MAYKNKPRTTVICEYCQKPLTHREKMAINPYDMHRLCFQHLRLRFVFNLDAYRNRKRNLKTLKKYHL